MALITCVECGKRVSSKHRVCPHCDEPLGELTPEEIALRHRRRHRRLIYRARMTTYAGMTLVILGFIIWYMTGVRGLALPPSSAAMLPVGIGFVVYVAAWAWLLWLRWKRPPTA